MALYDIPDDEIEAVRRALYASTDSTAELTSIIARFTKPAEVCVGVFILGGVVQGARATHPMAFELADQDELYECDLDKDPKGNPLACQCDPEDAQAADIASHQNTIERYHAVAALPRAIF